MAKKAKDILKGVSSNVARIFKPSVWSPLPDSVKCDRPINPEMPVRTRSGHHAVLVTVDDRFRWSIRARIIDTTTPDHSYIHSFTKNGAFNNESTPAPNDLFNVSRAEYAKRFPDDKGFIV